MSEKKEILLLLRKGMSIRKVSRELHVHRTVVRKIHDTAARKNWLNQNTPFPSDSAIAGTEEKKQFSGHLLDPYAKNIKQWHLEGVTGVVIQRFLEEKKCDCKIGVVRRYIKKICPKMIDPVMVRATVPGEVADVDFGFLGLLWNEELEKFKKAWIFSARLRHSRKAYRKIVWNQNLRTFLICHIHAFEHFQGVPHKVVLDNLKAGVIKSCVDNDMLNRAYKELAEYYGFMISPCLPRTPEHKGGVENDMKYVKRNFWVQIREKQKTNSHITRNQAQEALEKWNREVADVRKLQLLERSPNEIFMTEEVSALQPLPGTRWEVGAWFQYTVKRDWRIRYENVYYSVPYALIGQTVQVRVTAQFVKVFYEFQEIAVHPRGVKGAYMRNTCHAPPFKEAVLSSNREDLLHQAKELGEHVGVLCEKIFLDTSIDKLRPVRCLLQLALKYEKERVDKACERALAYNTFRYQSVKEILKKGLDLEPLATHSSPSSANKTQFKYARNSCEYKTIGE